MTENLADARAAQRALHCLDLTDLADECLPQAVDRLVERAITPHGRVAALCIWPQFVSDAAERLKGTGVAVATVVNFPAGGDDIERAVEDTRQALRDSADEIDLVLPYKALLRGDERCARDMVGAVAGELSPRQRLKVILETGVLGETAIIDRASRIAIDAGAHFLKTSTGKTAVSATSAAARTMLEAIRASRKPVGFKAAGGIRTLPDAALYLDLADEIMGAGWATPATFRIGASSLLDALLAVLSETDASG